MSLSRLFRRDAGPGFVSSIFDKAQYEQWVEEAKATVDAEEPLVIEPLPPYVHSASCPKCHFMPGTTEYVAGWHETCSIKGSPWNPTSFFTPFGLSGTIAMERFIRQRDVIPEHFERACPNCKHHWPEGVV